MSEIHISSLMVHARPDRAGTVGAALRAIPGAEICAEGGGRFAVVLECESQQDVARRLQQIGLLDGVMSAALAFHGVEDTE